MSEGKNIPDTDHVLRYCRSTHVVGNEILAAAFRLRRGEKALSVNWVERFKTATTIDAQIAKIRADVGKKITLAANGKFARINVGDIKERIEGAEVNHAPTPNNPSHAEIYTPEERLDVALTLARIVIDTFPTRA